MNIKMNVIVQFTFVIILFGMPAIHAIPNPDEVGITPLIEEKKSEIVYPGISSCVYFGSLRRSDEENIPMNQLAENCTSYIIYEVFIDENQNIKNSYTEKSEEQITQEFTNGKPLFIFYGQNEGSSWSKVLHIDYTELNDDSNNENDDYTEDVNDIYKKDKHYDLYFNKIWGQERNAIQTYCINKNITGLILNHVLEGDIASFIELSNNLFTYITFMKQGNTGLLYGLAIDVQSIEKYIDECLTFDLGMLSGEFDFFVITLANSNVYSKDYIDRINTGNILTKLPSILKDAGIPKEKTYFLFSLRPQEENDTESQCQQYYTLQGQFAGSNGAGFIGSFVDAKIGCQVSAFNFIIDGFNEAKQQPCELVDNGVAPRNSS